MTKRFLLPAAGAAVLITATAAFAATEISSHHASSVDSGTTVSSGTSGSSQPQVSVNGHNVEVPAKGSTTLKQGDTETTVSQQPSDDSEQSGTTSTTTTGKGDSTSVSVTSTTNGNDKHSHSNVRLYTSGSSDTNTSVHSQTQTNSSGAVTVSQ